MPLQHTSAAVEITPASPHAQNVCHSIQGFNVAGKFRTLLMSSFIVSPHMGCSFVGLWSSAVWLNLACCWPSILADRMQDAKLTCVPGKLTSTSCEEASPPRILDTSCRNCANFVLADLGAVAQGPSSLCASAELPYCWLACKLQVHVSRPKSQGIHMSILGAPCRSARALGSNRPLLQDQVKSCI